MSSASLIIVVALIFLGFVSGVLIVWAKIRILKDQVNPRIEFLGLYWDSFQLFDVPKNERASFFEARGRKKGIIYGVSADVFGALVMGTILLGKWLFYPKSKKQALAALAEGASLSKEEILSLTNQLR